MPLFAVLQQGGDKLEKLLAFKVLVFCLSYTIAATHFLGKKKYNYFLYFLVLFSIDIYCTIINNRLEPVSYYLCALLTCLFISRQYGLVFATNIALTILTVFQWIIAFLGSMIFIAYPKADYLNAIPYNFIMALSLILCAVVMRKNRHTIFKMQLSNTLLIIDIIAKLFFLVFLNLFLPSYFELLGSIQYAKLIFVFLLSSFIFVVYKEYTSTLEKQIALKQWRLQAVNSKACETVTKYQNERIDSTIQRIDNTVVQALLYELLENAEKHMIPIILDIKPIKRINLSNDDLFEIINTYFIHALAEAKTSRKSAISIEVNGNRHYFSIAIVTKISSNYKKDIYSDFPLVKAIIARQSKKNSNISPSVYIADNKFTQLLEIYN